MDQCFDRPVSVMLGISGQSKESPVRPLSQCWASRLEGATSLRWEAIPTPFRQIAQRPRTGERSAKSLRARNYPVCLSIATGAFALISCPNI
jgi:hypothetical protein